MKGRTAGGLSVFVRPCLHARTAAIHPVLWFRPIQPVQRLARDFATAAPASTLVILPAPPHHRQLPVGLVPAVSADQDPRSARPANPECHPHCGPGLPQRLEPTPLRLASTTDAAVRTPLAVGRRPPSDASPQSAFQRASLLAWWPPLWINPPLSSPTSRGYVHTHDRFFVQNPRKRTLPFTTPPTPGDTTLLLGQRRCIVTRRLSSTVLHFLIRAHWTAITISGSLSFPA